MPGKHQSSKRKSFARWNAAKNALQDIDNTKAFRYLFSIQYNLLYPEGSAQTSTKKLAKECGKRIQDLLMEKGQQETSTEAWGKFIQIVGSLSAQQVISITTYCCKDINQHEVARLRILLNDVDKQVSGQRYKRRK
jgi:hypothetical protein